MSQQINLFNPIFLRQKKYFSAVTMAQALGLILAGGIAMSAYSWYQSSSLAQQAVQTSARLEESQQQLNRINAQYGSRKRNTALEEEVNRMQAEYASLKQAMSLLGSDEFGDRKGYSSYMRAFSRQIVEGLWLTGFSIEGAGSAIGIQGSAVRPDLVPAYMRKLGQEPVLQGKSFAMLEMQQPKEKEDQKKDAGGKSSRDAKKVPVDHINFDLRSKLADKEADKGASGDAKKAADAPAQSMPASSAAATFGGKRE